MNKKDFIEFFEKLSEYGKRNIVFCPYSKNAMSLNVCYLEISNNTKLGKKILKDL